MTINLSNLNPGPSPERPTGPRVLFVGLGTMGLPMASNLARAGFDVQGFDTNADA
ncbi:MAG: NAD(P)-binding domain-containing protein, partial [Casimicrobiaceae bacterium]